MILTLWYLTMKGWPTGLLPDEVQERALAGPLGICIESIIIAEIWLARIAVTPSPYPARGCGSRS